MNLIKSKNPNAAVSIDDIVIDLEEYGFGKVHIECSFNLDDQFVKSKLQRSFDGIDYETINTAYHIPEINIFGYKDKSPQLGKNYYRLKVYYPDGSYEYSKEKCIVLLPSLNTNFVYPNPVSYGDFVHIKDYHNNGGNIKIYNMQGQLMSSIDNLVNGKVDVTALKAGSYILVQKQKSTFRKQLLVKN